ncbi:GGDEF family protein [Desulfamplus magnetovallimortis]|uniref:diguanylate cyclase n=1 Tax=Desulfamplus magnetovallimortis TaxID=1246637 RepID=A0A1W1HHT4_9BACT|nr:GGDEF domain-containing protein [Desulfamplus magnetovallimortis]SLM32044.1 GGDEF family protein [Desulfamplus magnetovallimortis]
MESFCWSQDYVIDLPEVDRQHRHLVEVINRFGDLLVQEEFSFDLLQAVFKELNDYSHYHFKEEEDMFFLAGVDRHHVNEHCDDHRHFLQEISNITDGLSDSIVSNELDIDNLRSLFRFLIHWLAYHILGADKNMARQIKAIESGMTPEAAYNAENSEKDNTKEPLIVALNGLFQEVSKRNRQLLRLNETLEAKVQERTRELHEANLHLEALSMTDVLTELPNRRYAMEQMKKLWTLSSKSGSPMACMLIDADGFKQINDNFGHDAGDVVLKKLAKELCYAVRSDDIVCRLGGDEFLIICPDTSHEGAMHIGGIVQQKISKLRVPAGEGVWYGSVSIGVAARSSDMQLCDDLVKAADGGVYAAKNAGKNCVRSVQP